MNMKKMFKCFVLTLLLIGLASVSAFAAEPIIRTTSLSAGTLGAVYEARLIADGDAPIVWSIGEDALPLGLYLSDAGWITGTPTETGIFTFEVVAANATGSDSKGLSIIVNAIGAAPVINTTTLQVGTIGQVYEQQLFATGADTIVWSISDRILPNGLYLSQAGIISGTPTATGVFTFEVTAENATGSDTKGLSITINATNASPVITTDTLSNGSVGEVYSKKLEATGADTIVWTISSGVLPNGLYLSQAGTISGTPTVKGVSTFEVTARNATGSDTKGLSIIINAANDAPVITTTKLQDGISNDIYQQKLTADGSAPISWSIISGSLPSGLSLDLNSGVISGIPVVTGIYTFSVRATNAIGNDSKLLSITINEVGVAPVITTSSLPVGDLWDTYDQRLSATGAATITWSILSGSLPPTLHLSASGVLSGTLTQAGVFSFVVMATNAVGSDSKSLSIVVNDVPISITTSSLPDGTVGIVYNVTLNAMGAAPITWSIETGSLPDGMSLNSGTGVIFGIPTVANRFSFTIRATNVSGSVTKDVSIVVNPFLAAPIITSTALPMGKDRTYYSTTLRASGTAPISWAIESGSLPPGLNLNPGTGEISGTPTTAGTYSFTVKATNTIGSDTMTFDIIINNNLSNIPLISTSFLQEGLIGIKYMQMLSSSGVTPLTWSIINGELPSGLTMNPDTGVISGTPTAIGTFRFTVSVINVNGSDTKELSITIGDNGSGGGGGGGSSSSGGCNASFGYVLIVLLLPLLAIKKK